MEQTPRPTSSLRYAAGMFGTSSYVPDRRHDWTFWDEQLPLFFDFILEERV